MPGAEEKVCQRQTRKEKNVVEIDRKAAVGDSQARKEGGRGGGVRKAHRPCSAAGVHEQDLDLRGKEAGKRAGAASSGNSVWRGSAMRARLTASL